SFMCTQTPTPTPRFDDEGRPIFTFTTGRFIMVFETKAGLSRLLASSCVGPNSGPSPGAPCPSHAGSPPGYDRNRPDARVPFSRPLGDGNPTVCDLGSPAEGGGGVPGTPDWLTIPGGDDVTAALQDASCKFEDGVVNSPGDSCALGRNGLPDFIDPTST